MIILLLHTIKKSARTNHFFLSVAILISGVHASPLETTGSSFANPFIMYYNPALISRQSGAPVGVSYYYNSPLRQYSLSAGFIETFKKSGFSLCYSKNNYEKFDRISTAFSSLYRNISFGATFHFVFSGSDPLFSLDAGGSYHFNNLLYAGVAVKNIFEADSGAESFAREVAISAGGELPWVKSFYYTVKGIVKLYDLPAGKIGSGGDVHLQKFFLKNPMISIYSRGALLYNREREIEWSAEACVGLHLFVSSFSCGVFGGYEYLSSLQDGRISVSVHLNPLYKRSTPGLSCALQLSSSKFSPDGDGKEDVLIIAQSGVFYGKNVRTKRWTLVIKKKQKPEDSIVRTFSGGDMPPSSTLWDGRDTAEKIVKSGEYSLQLFIVDTMERVVSSDIATVIVE